MRKSCLYSFITFSIIFLASCGSGGGGSGGGGGVSDATSSGDGVASGGGGNGASFVGTWQVVGLDLTGANGYDSGGRKGDVYTFTESDWKYKSHSVYGTVFHSSGTLSYDSSSIALTPTSGHNNPPFLSMGVWTYSVSVNILTLTLQGATIALPNSIMTLEKQ